MTLSVFDMSERLQDLRLGGTTNTSVVHDVGGRIYCTRGMRHTYCCNWLRNLLTAGVVPIQAILEVVPQENGPEAEKRWIHSLREQGAPLTNLTDGGEGTPGREVLPETRAKISAGQMGNKNGLGHTYSPSDETRTKMSAVHTGKKLSSETRARMSAVLVGNKRSLGCHPSEETRVKLSAAGLGRKHSPETRIKISAAHIGRKLSAEHRAEISAALTGRKRSPEAIMKGILANTGKKRSPEIRAKFSALRMGNKNLLGHHHSDETKRKMSVAHRAYWATQKGQRTNANM